MTTSYWLIFQNERLIIPSSPLGTHFITTESIALFRKGLIREHTLRHFLPTSVKCAELAKDFVLPPGFETISLKKALEILGDDWYTAATAAYTILNWDNNHQFCGRCSHATRHTPDTFERVCTQCGLSFYPRISPSVIVLIEKGNQLLMARSPHFMPGAYGLIAGFVEAGESLEDAIHREVKEEVGITIDRLRYFKSQTWPFPDSLMIGFFAHHQDGEIIIDRNEIEAADWYDYNKLPGLPSSSFSLASKLIAHFIAEKNHLNR